MALSPLNVKANPGSALCRPSGPCHRRQLAAIASRHFDLVASDTALMSVQFPPDRFTAGSHYSARSQRASLAAALGKARLAWCSPMWLQRLVTALPRV